MLGRGFTQAGLNGHPGDPCEGGGALRVKPAARRRQLLYGQYYLGYGFYELRRWGHVSDMGKSRALLPPSSSAGLPPDRDQPPVQVDQSACNPLSRTEGWLDTAPVLIHNQQFYNV